MDKISISDFAQYIAILIALVALWQTRLSNKRTVKFHLESSLFQLIDIKATEVNEIFRNNNYIFDTKTSSNILSVLISFRQCLDLMINDKIIIDKQKFVDIFYLQLNTSIRIAIKDNSIFKLENPTRDDSPIFIGQTNEIENWFRKSIEKYR